MTAILLLLLQLLPTAPSAGITPPDTRDVAAFTHVAVAAPITVLLHQGSPQQVRVEAAPEDLARLETHVDHDELRIRDRTADAGRSNQSPLGKVTVHITMPTVRSLYVANGSRLHADTLQVNQLWLEANSSGLLMLGQVQARRVSAGTASSGRVVLHQLLADTLQSTGASAGSLTVAGTCPYYRLTLSSGGHVQAEALAVETCTATLSSGSRGRVRVSTHLQAHASSGGQLTVLGNPQLSSRVSSGGRVQRQEAR
ncbi:GIN domain-containing protein [Hymenobacter mucosus]|uniref:Putative auto-transporter adhesin, head GIN domain n=1 Tax=Hymenobacter mucosus TaxID=1411120 RepID=A0A239AFD6_9BACT|nr:DUF2807 domain-containing protein [Hymenobacter mucosus]SNR94315.1 Putative auto-transporter adhesin, head GIN domain [Hymenobacter mucosus]